MINPTSITFVEFCDNYELPSGDFYGILRFINSSLNLQTKQKVVIIIDNILLSSKTEKEIDREFLLTEITQFLDQQNTCSDVFESVDLIVSASEVSVFKNVGEKSGRNFEWISLPGLY